MKFLNLVLVIIVRTFEKAMFFFMIYSASENLSDADFAEAAEKNIFSHRWTQIDTDKEINLDAENADVAEEKNQILNCQKTAK